MENSVEDKICVDCHWFNGTEGDGDRYCDVKDVEVNENDSACENHKHVDLCEQIVKQE